MAIEASSQAMSRRQQGGARRTQVRLGLFVALAVVAGTAWLRQSGAAQGREKSVFDTSLIIYDQYCAHAAVKADFPGAMAGPEVAVRVLKSLQPFGVRRKNVRLAQSILSDGVNGDRGYLSTIFTRQRGHTATLLKMYYGSSFYLGGLGGAVSDGKSSFSTFVKEVPQGGHAVVIYGAHISFSEVAAEQSRGKIFATMAYKIVEEEVMKMVHTNFGEGYLVLLGGIQINMPWPLPGYWLPMHFSLRSKGTAPKDLMAAFS